MSEHEEIEKILDEVADAIGGAGAILTLHPRGAGMQMLHHSPNLSSKIKELELWIKNVELRSGSHPADPRWLNIDSASPFEKAMLIPVELSGDHSPVVITVFFETFDEAAKVHAISAYAQRRPFAIGYFRLWQLARSQSKTIASFRSSLDLTDMAIMFCNFDGRIIFSNKSARNIIGEEDGVLLRNEALVMDKWEDSIKLSTAIQHVARMNDRPPVQVTPMFQVERKRRRPLFFTVMSAEIPTDARSDIAAIIFIIDPDDNPAEHLKTVCALYSLTPSETRLACLLASGLSLQQAAKSLRLKEPTARSYVKQIFSKTRTNRQVDLIRLLLKSSVPARALSLEAI